MTEAPGPYRPHSTAREATETRSLFTTTREQPLLATAREKPAQQWRPSTAKSKQINKIIFSEKRTGMLQQWSKILSAATKGSQMDI